MKNTIKSNWFSKPAAILLILNMWGIAILGTLLFLSALAGLAGMLPKDISLQMLGRTIESSADYHAFLVFIGALSTLGWLFVWLHVSGYLNFRFAAFPTNKETEQAADGDAEPAA